MGPRQANILDPVHNELDPLVWDDPDTLAPTLKPQHKNWLVTTIFGLLSAAGYDEPERYVRLFFTGSLTTYQYSDESDVDISLFVEDSVWGQPGGTADVVWKRGDLISVMVTGVEGKDLPGTPHPLQFYVVPPGLRPEDLYKPGMRSGYEIDNDQWIVPPEPERVHDVKKEMNSLHVLGLMAADKMERLLADNPNAAVRYWHQIHRRRARDMKMGKGDYSDSNVIYKTLANRGLFPRIGDVSGEYIAKIADSWDDTSSFLRPREEWRPGVAGKGFLGTDGILMWRIGPDMRPLHTEYMLKAKQALKPPYQAFHVKPDGTLWTFGRPLPQEARERIVTYDPRLKIGVEGESEWDWPSDAFKLQSRELVQREFVDRQSAT